MTWIPTALMLAGLALLAFHGALLLFRKENRLDQRITGILNLLLVVSAVIAYSLFASGSLIISPEYSVILAEGNVAWTWCLITILLIPFTIWMALHSIRSGEHRFSRLSIMLLLGAIVGIYTVIRAWYLNPASHTPFKIYCLDLWSFALLAWVVLCIGDWIFSTLKIADRLVRACGIAALLSYFAVWANQRAHDGFVFADKSTQPLWTITAFICIPMVLVLLSWIALRKSGWFRRIVQICVGLVAGLLGLITAVLATIEEGTLYLAWIVWGVWTGLLLIGLIPRIRSRVRRGWFRAVLRDRSPADAVVLLGLAVLAGCIADLSHFVQIDPSWDLALIVLAWLLLQEHSTGYPLAAIARKTLKIDWVTVSGVGAFGKLFRRKGTETVEAPKDGAPARGKTGVFVTSIAILFVLVAIPELFNAGKMIVEPFTDNLSTPESPKGQESTELGKAVADRMVNTLGQLKQELRPDLLVSGEAVILPGHPSSYATRKTSQIDSWVPAAIDAASDSQAVVAGNSLQIPGTQFSIPLGFFATPIQRPLRAALRVTVILGTLQKNGSEYLLLANSSKGESWRVNRELPTSTCHSTPLNSEPTPKPVQDEKGAAVSAPSQSDVVNELAEGLAYRIVSSDPNLTRRGITSVWTAITDFRNGLARWQSFETTANYDDLSLSIGCFRAAIDKDPSFALAYYRLGLALEADGQPGLAVDALRNSIRVSPRFVAGHLALAQVLSNYELYEYSSPPSLSGNPRVSAAISPQEMLSRLKSRYSQSEWLLGRVLEELKSEATLTDRAEAYVGLCRIELYNQDMHFESETLPPNAPSLMKRYRQFFYCKRAEYLYSKLSPKLRMDVRVLPNEEWVVKAIAYVLSHTVKSAIDEHKPNTDENWSCNDQPLKNTYLRFAARYYQRATEMDPYDNEASCGYAMARRGLDPDDKVPIDLLKDTPAARFALGSRLEQDGKFGEALIEYKAAIGEDSDNVSAMNNFAYTVYRWHVEALLHPGSKKLPGSEYIDDARNYAAKATRLTANAGARIDHRIMLSTAGELELALGNPMYAVSLLDDSLKEDAMNPTGINHPFFDEIRWDSAQACTCAGKIPEAKERLLVIREEEKGREDQRFVGPPDDQFVDRNLTVLEINCAYFKAKK